MTVNVYRKEDGRALPMVIELGGEERSMTEDHATDLRDALTRALRPTVDASAPWIWDTTTLRIRHNGLPQDARIDLVSPDGTIRPLELVSRIAFDTDIDRKGAPTKLSLDFIWCFGTLEIDMPVNGETVSRIVVSEQAGQRGCDLARAVHAVPEGATGGDAPEWLVRLYEAARAVVDADGDGGQ